MADSYDKPRDAFGKIQRIAQELSNVNGTELGGALDRLKHTEPKHPGLLEIQAVKNKMENLICDLEIAVSVSTPIRPAKFEPAISGEAMDRALNSQHSDPEKPEVFPPGTLTRINTVSMALMGAVEVFNEINKGDGPHCGVAGILDLAVAELTRINDEFDEFKAPRAPEVSHG